MTDIITRQFLRYAQDMSPADTGRAPLLFRDTYDGQNPPDSRYPYTEEKLTSVVLPGIPATPANDRVTVIIGLFLNGVQVDSERWETTNTALQARATARGVTTWDETDVAAEYEAVTGNLLAFP